MAPKDAAASAAPAKASAQPGYIKLAADGLGYRAGRVLKAEPDLIAALDAAGVKYSEATELDRRIGGCTD